MEPARWLPSDEDLSNPDYANSFLAFSLERINEPDGHFCDFIKVLARVVALRGGVAEVARTSGLSKQTIYGALAGGSEPRITTIFAILSAVGLRLTVCERIPGRLDRREIHLAGGRE